MKKSHDTIATRLAMILVKFNSGERFTADELCEEFNVDKRTIQRDLNNRLSYLPIKRENGYYSMESYALGKLTYNDIKNFAAISGIKSLYPSLTDEFIADILNAKINSAYLVKGYGYENIASKQNDFETISVAILQNKQIACNYKGKPRLLLPYKLVNKNAIWYLVADEDGVLKNFAFSKITDMKALENSFAPISAFVEAIEKSGVDWVSQTEIEVTLQIDNKVAEYFLRRELLLHQVVISHTDSYLTLSAKVSYEDEILNIVKYWLPYIKIITPNTLSDKLKDTLSRYLSNTLCDN